MVQIVTSMTGGFTTVILINVTVLSGCSTADKPFYFVKMVSKGTDSFGSSVSVEGLVSTAEHIYI